MKPPRTALDATDEELAELEASLTDEQRREIDRQRREIRSKAVDELLSAERRRKPELLAAIIEECQSDSMFLERVRKALPKRSQGRAADAVMQQVFIKHVIAAFPDWTNTEQIELLAKLLNLSESRAKTIYYDYKKEC